MYCSHCGKKIMDSMLFCPFCGDPVVIPDQDEPEAPAEVEAAPESSEENQPEENQPEAPDEKTPGTPVMKAPEVEPKSPYEELMNWDFEREALSVEEAAEVFEPLKLPDDDGAKSDWREDIVRRKEAAAPEKKLPEARSSEDPSARLDGFAPKLDRGLEEEGESHRSRSANTFVPAKAMDPDDMFMDGGEEDAFDAFDRGEGFETPTPAGGKKKKRRSQPEYEEEREGGFFARHIRGIVGLTLFIVLVLIFGLYACSEGGQRMLATTNLAWDTDIYATMAYEFYQAEDYEQAGQYYERALSRDEANYSYASSAAMSYVTGENTSKAVDLLKKCVEINPTMVEPYVYLANLYPDEAQRPWDITDLIRKGYQLTGDARLKLSDQ